MSSIRTWHTYLGILIAPSVLFFAVTGALQLFSLHESHGSYQPAVLIEKLSSVHKDQVFAVKAHEDHGEPGAGPDSRNTTAQEEHEAAPSVGTVLLKWYFLVVAVALTTSTLLGLWLALTRGRTRTRWWLLGLGTFLPILLTAF